MDADSRDGPLHVHHAARLQRAHCERERGLGRNGLLLEGVLLERRGRAVAALPVVGKLENSAALSELALPIG